MKKIAILAADKVMPQAENPRADFSECAVQMKTLTAAFAQHNMALDLVPWRVASQVASEYEAMLPLFVWDYFEGNEEAFISEMAKVDRLTLLLNPFDTLRWNANKSYLDVLEGAGAPVISSYVAERVTPNSVERAFDYLETNKVIIKPLVGGGAWRQVLHRHDAPLPPKEELPPKGALIQPFLDSVVNEGEYSFLYFGGNFSHAVLKLAKSGDYRVQAIYGGREQSYTPSSEERATARAVLDALDYTPLYARVDLLRGEDGALKLIELEMIEPYLYLAHADGEGAANKGAQKLAEALIKRLND